MSESKQNSKNRKPRRQPRKDSSSKRVNYDNTRETRFERDINKERKASGYKDDRSNDISWYSNNPTLMQAASSISFYGNTGLLMRQFADKTAVPGVMRLVWDINLNGAQNVAVKEAMNSMYSYVVHANSRNKSYDAPDQMLIVLAGTIIFSQFALGMRAFGVMQNFNQEDAYTPSALIAAMGFDYSDLRNNLSNMWFDLNELAVSMQQLWIPNTMPVLQRWYWLNSNVYRDGDSVKSQYYLFVPESFYIYRDVDETHDYARLEASQWAEGATHTWREYVSIMRSCLAGILNSQDRGIIFGDILKAYGADKLYALNPVPVDYKVVPTYDREVLSQIENATVFGNGNETIEQNVLGGFLYNKGKAVAKSAADTWLPPAKTQMLNFHQLKAPTPEQIMIATRLKSSGIIVQNIVGEGGSKTYNIVPGVAGTEYLTHVGMYTNVASIQPGVPFQLERRNINVNTWNTYLTNQGLDIREWLAFDWAPWFYTVNPPIPSSVVIGTTYHSTAQYAVGDYDNFTTINSDDLEKMHNTATYSLFGVPIAL